MLKKFLVIFGLLFSASWVQSSVIYQVTADYAGGYHYNFYLEFSDDQGIKTEADIVNDYVGPYPYYAEFWGDPGSRFGGKYHLPASQLHGALVFDPANPLAMQYRAATTGWTWYGNFDPVLNREVQVEVFRIDLQEIAFQGLGNTEGLPQVSVDLRASRVGLQVSRVPEPGSLPLVGLALISLVMVSARAPSRKG